MKSLSCLLLIAIGLYLPVCSAQETPLDFTDLSPFSSPPQLMLVSYHTTLLPNWTFDVEYDRDFLPEHLGADIINQHSPIDSLRLSASRRLTASSSQRIYASVQGSYEQNFGENLLYLNSNAGMAASFGWQLGDRRSLNMAVEYEYREVGEFDINTLIMGVQYAF